MSKISMIAPDVCQITVECPLCEADIAVVHHEGTERFDVPHSCEYCGKDFVADQRWALLDAAKGLLDNYCPTDAELRAAGMLAE